MTAPDDARTDVLPRADPPTRDLPAVPPGAGPRQAPTPVSWREASSTLRDHPWWLAGGFAAMVAAGLLIGFVWDPINDGGRLAVKPSQTPARGESVRPAPSRTGRTGADRSRTRHPRVAAPPRVSRRPAPPPPRLRPTRRPSNPAGPAKPTMTASPTATAPSTTPTGVRP